MTYSPNHDLCIGFLGEALSARAGGIAVSMFASSKALTRHGVTVEVFGLRDSAFGSETLPYPKGKVHIASAWNAPGLRLAPALDRALAARDLDVLHQHGLWLYPSIATSRWRQRTGRPVVISPHGMLDPWALNNSGWKKRLARLLYEDRNLEGAACLHALNHEELRAFRDLGLRNPVAVVPNGVDLPSADDPLARPNFLSADHRQVLLFLGRIHPKKGLAETLMAWARARMLNEQIAKDWVLVVAGWDDGGHVESLQKMARELGLEGSVYFPGPSFGEDKARVFAHANAFILASHSEGLPMAVLEAWAHRLPVLMTRACNLPTGFEVGAAVEITVDPEALADNLVRYLSDPALPGRGEAGRDLVERCYSWDSAACDLIAVYRWLAGRASRPDCVVID